MSAYRHAVAVDAAATDQRLALAAEILSGQTGVVLFEGILALRPTRTHVLCAVIDPTPAARRCANEYEVLVENAKRAFEASTLRQRMPDRPCRWVVVEVTGSDAVEVWREP